MMKNIKLGAKMIEAGGQPFIIAEMSGNHNQSLNRALAIVDAAADAGVQAVKIQTYTADTMTIDVGTGEFYIKDPKSLWKGSSLYKLYQRAYTPWEWHKPIFERCQRKGLIGFSSPFDGSAVDFLEGLNVPCYKIASFELVDIPLIKRVAATGKPIIMSTGMATVAEIKDAVKAAKGAGCRDIVLLKCTSSYPATPQNSNVLSIPDLARRFDCLVGLSDHTLGIGAAVASVALGASVIEKHFTLSRSDGGVDSAFSLEPGEMKLLVEETHRAWQALGKISYGPTEQDKKSLIFRRSVYAVRDIEIGERFTTDNIRVIRPGLGLLPKYYEHILGKKARRSVKRGIGLKWTMVDRPGNKR
jgi:pseudaminic acid synthase